VPPPRRLGVHAWGGPVPVRSDELPEFAGLTCQRTFLADTNQFLRCLRDLLTNLFLGLDTADHALVNSFFLEPQVSE
jgi:pathogen-inducible salicylic acid glucosyltransferase